MEKVNNYKTQKTTGKRRNTLIKKLSLLFALLFLLTSVFTVCIYGTEANELADEILTEQVNGSGCTSIQEWIDKGMNVPSDGSEWYIMCLHQYGEYNYSRYAGRLISYLKENKVSNVVSKLKYALTLLACNVELPEDTYNLTDQGVMTYIYALHLSSNSIELSMTKEQIVEKLLSLQNKRGWSITQGDPDVDVTAMAITALSPYYSEESVKKALDESIEYLSEVQLPSGSFFGFSEENCETIAQVVIALSSVGIDCQEDERFIKGGRGPVDALLSFKVKEGCYSHSVKGETNKTATNQTLQALIAYGRMKDGKGPLFVFDKQTLTEPDYSDIKNTETDKPDTPVKKGFPVYKIVAVAVVVVLAAAVILIMLKKKMDRRNIFFVAGFALILALVIIFVNISLPSDRGKDIKKDNPIGTITMTIECKVLIGEESKYVPENGIILDKTSFEIEEGDTALKILREAASKYNLQLEVKNGYYVLGINNLYEKEFGDLSGWMYYINGKSASVGANEYVPKDGDLIEWRFTRNIGKDLENN